MSLRKIVVLAIVTSAISIAATCGAAVQASASASSATIAMPERSTFETGGVTIWFEVRGEGAGTPLVLVIAGRYDFNVAPSVAYAIHRAIPGSEFAVFEKSGHLPFYEATDAFVNRLEAFLK